MSFSFDFHAVLSKLNITENIILLNISLKVYIGVT